MVIPEPVLFGYAKILEPSRGSRAFGLAAELLKQCIAGDLLTSGWRLGAHRFDVAWINGVPYSPGDVTINQDFLYGPDFINRAVITPDGLFIDGKLAVVEVQG